MHLTSSASAAAALLMALAPIAAATPAEAGGTAQRPRRVTATLACATFAAYLYAWNLLGWHP